MWRATVVHAAHVPANPLRTPLRSCLPSTVKVGSEGIVWIPLLCSLAEWAGWGSGRLAAS